MLLEHYFTELKEKKLLSKYSNYLEFEYFIFDLKKLSNNFNGIYRTVKLSNVEPMPNSFVSFLEDTIYPTYFLRNPSPKVQFEFVYFLLKSEGLIKNFQTSIQLLEYLKNNQEINSFIGFLRKSGYCESNDTRLKNGIVDYKEEFDKLIEEILISENAADYARSLDIIIKNINEYSESDFFKSKINIYGHKYFEKLAIEIPNFTILNLKDLNTLFDKSSSYAKLLPDDKSIKNILNNFKLKTEELVLERNVLNDFIGLLDTAKTKLEKQPLATFCDDLEDDIIKNSPNAYFKEIAIGKVMIENNSWPITFPFAKENSDKYGKNSGILSTTPWVAILTAFPVLATLTPVSNNPNFLAVGYAIAPPVITAPIFKRSLLVGSTVSSITTGAFVFKAPVAPLTIPYAKNGSITDPATSATSPASKVPVVGNSGLFFSINLFILNFSPATGW